jgi:hypothetical protein
VSTIDKTAMGNRVNIAADSMRLVARVAFSLEVEFVTI